MDLTLFHVFKFICDFDKKVMMKFFPFSSFFHVGDKGSALVLPTKLARALHRFFLVFFVVRGNQYASCSCVCGLDLEKAAISFGVNVVQYC